MRGSVNSFEHFLQMVLGDSRVTFDAIWTAACGQKVAIEQMENKLHRL